VKRFHSLSLDKNITHIIIINKQQTKTATTTTLSS